MFRAFKAASVCLAFVGTAFTASAADMIENYNPPPHVRTIHRTHQVPVRVVSANRTDCGQLIVEYRTDPQHTEIKTLCSPPWTPPSGSAESGSVSTASGSTSSSTATQ